MKKLLSAVVALALCATVAMAVTEAKEKNDLKVVKGVVQVTKEGDQVQKIEIVAKEKDEAGNEVEKAYCVAGDKASEVAKLEGKEVEAKGTIEDKDGVATLTVKEVKEVAEKKAE